MQYTLFPDPSGAGVRDRTLDQALLAMLVTARSMREKLKASGAPLGAVLDNGKTLTCQPDDTIEALRARCAGLDPNYQVPAQAPDFVPGDPR